MIIFYRPEYNERATKIKVSSATGLPEKYMSGKEKYCRIAITYVTCIILVRILKTQSIINLFKS